MQPGFSHQYNTFENYGRYNRDDDISETQVVKVENIAVDVRFCVTGSLKLLVVPSYNWWNRAGPIQNLGNDASLKN